MTSRQKRLLVGNWKMNPVRIEDARRIVAAYKKVAAKLSRTRILTCPPFVYLSLAVGTQGGSKGAAKISAGGQDAFYESDGPFTGETSAKMLRDLGATHVILGHSERRKLGDTDEIVSRKATAVLGAGLTAIVCIGEAVHDAEGAYLETLRTQIKSSLSGIPQSAIGKLVIAYEPIWAIGAQEAMKPEDIRETALFIKKVIADIFGHDEALDLSVLYGGSVNWRNAGDIIRIGEVDGLLVGRESVNVPGFVELAKAVDEA